MFTGLIQCVGTVAAMKHTSGSARLVVSAPHWQHTPELGESIAVNGCCLTVAEPDSRGDLHFDVIDQTLQVTTLGELQQADKVNLEHAVRPSDLMGGHVVQGHVDGVGVVQSVLDQPGERRVRIQPPSSLLDAVIDKGSIAVNGVSLTVAALGDRWFEVALIPTTLRDTTLGSLEGGLKVNLEADYIAKTVVHWLERQKISGR